MEESTEALEGHKSEESEDQVISDTDMLIEQTDEKEAAIEDSTDIILEKNQEDEAVIKDSTDMLLEKNEENEAVIKDSVDMLLEKNQESYPVIKESTDSTKKKTKNPDQRMEIDSPKEEVKQFTESPTILEYKALLARLSDTQKICYIESHPEIQLALEFNYEFNNRQKLVHIDTKEPFKFTNQAEYERLGKLVQKIIEHMMFYKYTLVRREIPLTEGKIPRSYIYISPNFNNPARQHPKALLLIQGAGAVRPGIWARSVCINDTLKTGSMNSFLSFALKHKFEVLIFNPNKNRSKGRPIPENHNLEAHGRYVWKTFIRNNAPSDLYIVAHSCGGISTVSLMEAFWEEFKERVKGIAFTDAVHGYYGMGWEKKDFCRRRAVDWIASSRPLDTREGSRGDPIVYLSSGHHKHEYTTGYARKSIKKYLLKIDEANPYL